MEAFYLPCLVQTDATLLANNPQHCWMLHVGSACTPCCLLLHVVVCCWAKFETVQNFEPTTPNISFVPWSPKRSATMLDPFAQLFQHCWGHERALLMVSKVLRVVSFPRCTAGPNIVRSCLHTTHQHGHSNSQHCRANNNGSCCVRLHVAFAPLAMGSQSLYVWRQDGLILANFAFVYLCRD